MPIQTSPQCKVQSEQSKKKTFHFSLITNHFKVKRGFTLVELLVVISIIGILSSFVSYSIGNAQAKGRDSRRKSDLDTIKKALELAKTDSTASAFYPKCVTYTTNECTIAASTTNPAMSTTYLSTVPKDPKTSINYTYHPTPDSCGVSGCTGYTLYACLENGNEPVVDNVVAVASTVCSSLRQLQVTNP